MDPMYYTVEKVIDFIEHNLSNITFFEVEIYPETKTHFVMFLRYKLGDEVYTEKYDFDTSHDDYYKAVRRIEEFLDEMEKRLYKTMEEYLIDYIKHKYPGSKILNIYKYEGTVTAEITTADGKFMIVKIIYYRPFKKHYEGIPGIGAVIYLRPIDEIITVEEF